MAFNTFNGKIIRLTRFNHTAVSFSPDNTDKMTLPAAAVFLSSVSGFPVGITPESEIVEWMEEVVQQQVDVVAGAINQLAGSVYHPELHAVANQEEQ